jgi:hypothetical protein
MVRGLARPSIINLRRVANQCRFWSAVACHRFGRAESAEHSSRPFSEVTVHQRCGTVDDMLWHAIPTVSPSRPKVSLSREASETWHGPETVPQPTAILECGGLPPLWPRRIGRVLRPSFSAGIRECCGTVSRPCAPSRPKVSSPCEANETWPGPETVPQPSAILECGGLPPLWPRRIGCVLRPLFSAGIRECSGTVSRPCPPSRPKVSSSREANETWPGPETVPQPTDECGGKAGRRIGGYPGWPRNPRPPRRR